jgi:hypothetical protein
MARFLAGSRYTNGVVSINRNGDQFLVLRELLVMPPAPTDSFITVTNEMINRPDIISFIAYQRPDLWWAIFDINTIKNPFGDLQINQRLRLPELSLLLAAINQLNLNL